MTTETELKKKEGDGAPCWSPSRFRSYVRALDQHFNRLAQDRVFRQFQLNEPKALLCMQDTDTINGITIAELNACLLPAALALNRKSVMDLKRFADTSQDGFLQQGEDLRFELARDAQTVRDAGHTHATLLEPFVLLGEELVAMPEATHHQKGDLIVTYPGLVFRDNQQNPFANEKTSVAANEAWFGAWGVETLLDTEYGLFGTLDTHLVERCKDDTLSERTGPLSALSEHFRDFFREHIWPQIDGLSYFDFWKKRVYKWPLGPRARKELEELVLLLDSDDLRRLIALHVKTSPRLLGGRGSRPPLVFTHAKSGRSVEIHSLTLAMILQFGFYQSGKYRVDPAVLIEMLE